MSSTHTRFQGGIGKRTLSAPSSDALAVFAYSITDEVNNMQYLSNAQKCFFMSNKLRWPRELNALQLQKTHANRKSTSKSRKHFHQFDGGGGGGGGCRQQPPHLSTTLKFATWSHKDSYLCAVFSETVPYCTFRHSFKEKCPPSGAKTQVQYMNPGTFFLC